MKNEKQQLKTTSDCIEFLQNVIDKKIFGCLPLRSHIATKNAVKVNNTQLAVIQPKRKLPPQKKLPAEDDANESDSSSGKEAEKRKIRKKNSKQVKFESSPDAPKKPETKMVAIGERKLDTTASKIAQAFDAKRVVPIKKGRRTNSSAQNKNNTQKNINDPIGDGIIDPEDTGNFVTMPNIEEKKHLDIITLEPDLSVIVHNMLQPQYVMDAKNAPIASLFEQVKIREDEKNGAPNTDPRMTQLVKEICNHQSKTTVPVDAAIAETINMYNIEEVLRSWNAQQLRVPVGNERPCIKDTGCWAFTTFGIILKEFITQREDLEMRRTHERVKERKKCLTCYREHVMARHVRTCVQRMPEDQKWLFQSFRNSVNVPGEYYMGDCVPTGASLPYPVVANKKSGYVLKTINGVAHLSEDGYLMYTIKEDEKLHKQKVIAQEVREILFQRGALPQENEQ